MGKAGGRAGDILSDRHHRHDHSLCTRAFLLPPTLGSEVVRMNILSVLFYGYNCTVVCQFATPDSTSSFLCCLHHSIELFSHQRTRKRGGQQLREKDVVVISSASASNRIQSSDMLHLVRVHDRMEVSDEGWYYKDCSNCQIWQILFSSWTIFVLSQVDGHHSW